MTAYARLKHRFERIGTLQEAQSVLDWDASAMMPAGGSAARADQLAVLAGLAHEQLTAQEAAGELDEAEAAPPGDEWEGENLRLMRHAHTRATALPHDLVLARTKSNSLCEKAWRDARQASDFAAVAPYLVEVVGLAREAAAALGDALSLAPYDAMMDGYQRGIGAADVAPIFARYQDFLGQALPAAMERQARQPQALPLAGVFPADRQEGVCRHLAARAGLDFQHARLDRSAHPFCGGTPTDVRLTTRYNEGDPSVAVMGVLHETGHALYERGLPLAHARQPVGESAGMAVHESQSLLLEMQACRSDAFLSWLGPELFGAFGGEEAPYAANNLARLWRRVEPGLIRVDADELTYTAHVVVRFDIERRLIEGTLQVADLPGAWQDGMRGMLGVSPPDDARGCLQDIHWYFGAFGYFPSYSLGAMAAAQLMAAAVRAVPDLEEGFAAGALTPLTDWLRTQVHAHGSRYGFNALLTEVTGEPLNLSYFEAHLRRRYLDGG